MIGMKRRGLVLFSIALVLALAAGVLVSNFLAEKERELGERISVIVVRQEIPARTILDLSIFSSGKVTVEERPILFTPQTAIQVPKEAVADVTQVLNIIGNWVTMVKLMPGDILQWNQLDPNAGLAPGMRAVSIAVNQVTSVGGNVRPGQRVDIVVSYEAEDRQGNKVPTTMLLAQDVEVISVYGNLPGQGQGGSREGTYGPSPVRFLPTGEMMKDTTVTFALPIEEAMKLTYMSNFAKEVRLLIRRLDEQTVPSISPITSDLFPGAR